MMFGGSSRSFGGLSETVFLMVVVSLVGVSLSLFLGIHLFKKEKIYQKILGGLLLVLPILFFLQVFGFFQFF